MPELILKLINKTSCCLFFWLGGILILLPGLRANRVLAAADLRPNVLFIAIDDLRNDLGVLGVEHAHTPHLDQFASMGRLFNRHFVQVPSCGPSRAALLRGKRPTDERYLPNSAIRNTSHEWETPSLPAWFRQNGYLTLSVGKITHYPGGLTGEEWANGPEELPGAWDRAWIPDSPWKTPLDMMHGYANGVPRIRGVSPAWEAFSGPDTAYPDAWVARDAVEMLEVLSNSEQPWFFAVGFFKPHLPFAAPKKWYDLHDPAKIPIPTDTLRQPWPSSWHPSGEMMNNYGRHPADPRGNPEYAKRLRHGYAAATSYMDHQIGHVLQACKRLGLKDNTIIVIWSDHGFALGEQAIWGKHSLYEAALKSPLIIYYPGIKRPGEISPAIVETVDIYPTLLSLAGLPCPGELHGQDLRPQLDDPGAASEKPAFAFTTRNSIRQNSVRTDRWRLIVLRPETGEETYELFDFSGHDDGLRKNPADHNQTIMNLLDELNRLPWQNKN